MGTVLRTSTPGPRVQQAPLPVVDAAPEEDPDEVAMRAEIARLEASLGQPQKAMYTPEQIQQRRTMNEADTQFGMLGMLSGQPGMSEAGGMLFKNALAQAQPRVTEHGVADGISGEFSYNPGYLDEKTRNKLDNLRILRLTLGAKATAAAKAQQNQRDIAGAKIAAKGAGGAGEVGSGTAPVVGADDQGHQIFRGKSGILFRYDDDGQAVAHTGPLLQKPTKSEPSEDEKKAAGWLAQAKLAYSNMSAANRAEPNASSPGLVEKGVSLIPGVGEDLAYAQMSPARQRFTTAASSLSEAVLRAATGAGVGEAEAKQKVRELTPRWREDPTSIAMKQNMAEMYITSLQTRAGRAVPKADPAAAGTPDNDPLGLRGRK